MNISQGTMGVLKTSNSYVAQEIVNLQLDAYAVEAELIGTRSIPTLYDTQESIMETDEIFIGYKIKRELVGLISYKLEYGILDVHRLAVKPAYFKKGIACQLLKYIVDQNNGVQKIIVATGADNYPAIKLYEKAGFKISREFEVDGGVKIAQLELIDFIDFDCGKKEMRDSGEMMSLILDHAQKNEDIRAVLMNGSRVNPNVEIDDYCDYDIVYAVEDPERYLKDQSWQSVFGKTIIIQQNDFYVDKQKCYIFLMLFEDGNRIDLQFQPIDKIHLRDKDSLEKVLLDKDNLLDKLPPPEESLYYTEKPTGKEVLGRINNIIWCSTNVVKGLCRGEFNYAKRMQEQIIRADLNTVMRWYIGLNNKWNVNSGVFGKWMEKHLTEAEWSLYLETCAGAEYASVWDATYKMIELTHKIGVKLVEGLGLDYPHEDEAGVLRYIETHHRKWMNERIE